MNRGLLLAVLSIAAVGGALFFLQDRTPPIEPAPTTAVTQGATSKEILGVEQFMRTVDSHPGQVRLEGVVSAVATEEQVLTLVDVAEVERCGVVTCAPLSLPVRWTGAMPAVRDVVLLRGEVSESGGKLFFLANALERVERRRTEIP